jgi:hypothetical protein
MNMSQQVQMPQPVFSSTAALQNITAPPKKSLFLSPPSLENAQTKSATDHKTVSKADSKEKKLKDLKK